MSLAEIKLLELYNFSRLQPSWHFKSPFSKKEIIQILTEVSVALKMEDRFLKLKAPLKVVGDINGQFFDLLRIVSYGGVPS